MFQALPSTLDRAQPDAEKIELLARALSPQDVQLYYQIALKGRSDLPLAPSERVGLEMVVLRMMAFKPTANVSANAISTQAPVESVAQPAASNARPQVQSATIPASPMSGSPVQEAKRASVNPAMQPQARPNTPAHGNAPQPQAAQDIPDYDMPPMPNYMDEASYHQDAPNFAPEQAATQVQQPMQPQAKPQSASSPVSGLRHQLRSQRKGMNPAGGPTGNSPKKAKATSEKQESVIDRVAQKRGSTGQVSPTSLPNAALDSAKDEPYQWKPSQPQVIEQHESRELAPTILKKSLEHEKTPEMAQKLVDESLERSPWAKLISQLTTAKLTEQLALNSHYEKSGNTIQLTLRSQQAHLNTDKAQSELLGELNRVLGEECHLSVEIGQVGETPLELRDKLYQARLQQAFTSLGSDSHIQFIEKRFAAQIDKESVRPI
jgi:DNA polymerase-3 subunit gamma/tau